MTRKKERARANGERSPEERPRQVVSLLGQRAEPGEAPPERGDRAPGTGNAAERPERRAASGPDPLRSEHSRFDDLEAPRDDFDPERARRLCAQVARDALADFAPALVLLPAETRLRAQALLAYARTLLDFARDRSLEGERLAQINRFEFALEAALEGEPIGQPVFVQMAALEARRPWPREAFDELASIARSRVSVGLPARPAQADAQRRRLARAALHALLGEPPASPAESLGAIVLRAASLLAWHEALWFHRPDLGLDPDDTASSRFRDAIGAEAGAITTAVGGAQAGVAAVPERYRPAFRYTIHAAAALARQAAAHPDSPRPPRLSAPARLALLLRARMPR